MSKQTDKVIKLAKEKARVTRERTIKTIEEMHENGDDITFYSVYKRARVSKAYVYSNPIVREMIENHREKPVKKLQNKDSKDVIIDTQRKTIKVLEKRIKELESYMDYKEKYDLALEEINQLKEQLKVAYKY